MTDKRILYAFMRQLAYLAGCFAIILLQHMAAGKFLTETYEEHGFIEFFQLFELVLAVIMFLLAARKCVEMRTLFNVFALLVMFAVSRELDSFLDTYLPIVGWKAGFCFIAVGAWLSFRQKDKILGEALSFIESREFIMMLCSVMLIIPIAQCLGHKSFIANVLADSHVGEMKELYEESIETMGYFILLCSSIEVFLRPSFIEIKYPRGDMNTAVGGASAADAGAAHGKRCQ